MTEASNGLRNALARSASGAVIALAEMSADDILGNLSDEQRTGLAASLAAPAANAAKPDPEADPNEDEPDGDPDDKAKKGMPKCDDKAEASSDRVKAVAAAVATDPACKGKASVALSMLADDDFAGLSASAIIKLIGNADVSGASAGDPEDAARAEMRDALASGKNSRIVANGADSDAPTDYASGWKKATAQVNQRNGFRA